MGVEDFLYEDEDDLFMGSPRSKFFDIIFGVGNRDLAKHKLENIVQMVAILELMLPKDKQENLEEKIKIYLYENKDLIEEKKKSLFIEYMGDILMQTDS
jgi:hypothetical protein